MMGGCFIRGTQQYDLIILYMMGNYAPPFPVVYAETIEFEDEEIEDNWQRLVERKAVLDNSLATGTMPLPYQYCYDWECRFCRYKLICETITRASDISKELEDNGQT